MSKYAAGDELADEKKKLCELCGHPFDPHAVLATTGDPKEGGIILCPVQGCQCYATWDVPQLGGSREAIYIPDERELVEMRAWVQQR